MGTWSASIFGNDTACDIKEEFFDKYNGNKEITEIKDYFASTYDYKIDFDAMFSIAHCLWEIGALDDGMLSQVEDVIVSGIDLENSLKLGADEKYIKQRKASTEKFLAKIKIPKEKPKKRVALPKIVDSKYRNGAILIFQYDDLTYGALVAVDSKHYDKETYYTFLQTDVKVECKPTMEVVLKSHILDDCFHSYEYQEKLGRSKEFYYSFTKCINDYLKLRETKRFEAYNDKFFEVIGYISNWGRCISGGSGQSLCYNAKTYDEFFSKAKTSLTSLYYTNLSMATDFTVSDIDKEFTERIK